MSHLFSATRIGQLTLDNRIVIAPMCQYSADEGKATSWHRIHLGQLAFSGAGLLILEATAVEPAGRISPGDLGLWDDETENALRGVVEDIRAWSPIRLGIQLGHAGRKASCAAPWQGGHQLALNDGGWQTVAPSAVAFHDGDRAPAELSHADLARIKAAFVASALRAQRLGFELIELHAAHGYLLHQFLSPSANQRTDQYGGSVENRARLVLEVVDAVSQEWSAERIGIRVSPIGSFQNVDNGPNEEEDALYLISELAKRGIAYLHMSEPDWAGGKPYSEAFRQKVRDRFPGVIIGAGAYTVEKANDLINKGLIDAVAFGRDYIANPDLVARLQK
ncbi:oxidoreductase, partial [Klebsiella pneumoniae]